MIDPSPIERIDQLNESINASILNELGDAFPLCEQVLTLSAPDGLEKPAYPKGAAIGLQNTGRIYKARSQYGQALDYFQKALKIFEDYQLLNEAALCRSYIGATIAGLGDYSQAAEILRQSLREAEEAGNSTLEAEILNDLSYNMVLAGDPELALNHLDRCIRIFRDLKDDLRLSWSLDSLGNAYSLVGRHTEAIACIMESLALAEKHQIWQDMAHIQNSAGKIFRKTGDPERALEMYQSQLELGRRLGLTGEICGALISIASLSLEKQASEEAIEYLQEARKLNQETGDQAQLSEIYQLLSTAYKQQRKFQQALEFHEQFHATEKIIFNDQADQRLKNLKVLYQLETAKKQAEIYHLRTIALQEEVEEQRSIQSELKEIAGTDPLTNVLNRRAFLERAATLLASVFAHKLSLAMILIDIDHFKAVNDQYGHPAGDQALRVLAERMKNNSRSNDLLCRYGGEEFIIILPDISRQQALDTAERLRAAANQHPIQLGTALVSLTLSVGLTFHAPKDPEVDINVLILQADQALYTAKNSGRNRVCIFDGSHHD